MKTQLFLIYLQIKKPLILFTVTLSMISLGLNLWSSYKAQASKLGAWRVVKVISGERITLEREEKSKTIQLCGVSAPGEEAKEYLKSSIQRGDGTVYLEKTGEMYEAWVILAPEYQEQIHLNTWLVQNGMARHELENSKQCLAHENLGWAEALAKEEKLGIWSEK